MISSPPERTFMVADLDNVSGNLDLLPEAIKEAQEYSHPAQGKFCRGVAEQVGEAFAERVADDWDYPTSYDLVIWEGSEGEQPTGPAYRVKVNVRTIPVYTVAELDEVAL